MILTPYGYSGRFGQYDINMKKIFIILFILISVSSYGRRKEIAVTDITGTDTTLYIVPAGNSTLVTIDFTTINSDDSTLDFGFSYDGVSFVSATISNVTFPLTLSKVTYTKTAGGYTRSRVGFITDNQGWYGLHIAVKLTKTSATAGTWIIDY